MLQLFTVYFIIKNLSDATIYAASQSQ